jgi:hypothetical protein
MDLSESINLIKSGSFYLTSLLTRNDTFVVKNWFDLVSSLFASVRDTTDPQPKSGLSFIVNSLTISDEIHEPYINLFIQSIA